MEKRETAQTKDKITLPEPLQREMIRFFAEASAKPKAATDKAQQPPDSNELERESNG